MILLLMDSPKTNKTLGGGFKDFFLSPPTLGEGFQFDEHIFADGLVQPPTRTAFHSHCWKPVPNQLPGFRPPASREF